MRRLLFASLFVALSVTSLYAQTVKWEKLNGPWGGGAGFLWQMGDVVFTTAFGGAIYKSEDSGASWQRIGFLGSGEGAVVVSGSTIYNTTSNGLQSSTDSGKTWKEFQVDTIDPGGTFVVIDDSTLFLLNEQGVFRSTNRGLTWRVINASWYPSALCTAGGTLYLINGQDLGSGGISRSTNNGESWTHLDTTFESYGRYMFAQSSNSIFVAAQQHLYRSTDSAKSWSILPISSIGGIQLMCQDGKYLFAVADSVYRSEDSGITWSSESNGLPNSGVTDIEVVGTWLIAATANGIFRSSDNGDTWLPSDSGISAATNLIASDGKVLLASINNGVYCTTDDGLGWSQANGNVGSSIPSSFALRDTTWFATTGERYFTDAMVLNKSTDGGVNWDSCGILSAGMFMVADKEGIIFGGGWAGGGLYRTLGNDNDWTALDSGAFLYSWESASTAALSDSLLVALIDSGASESLIVSTDFGNTWQRGNIFDSAIYSLGVSGRVIVMGTDSGIYRSTDLGLTWIRVSAYMNADIMEAKDTTILASSVNGGVLLSTDFGLNWNAFNDGLPSLDISAFAIGSGEIYAALASGGIFHSKLPIFSGVSQLPSYSAQSNIIIFPNPFSSSSTIQYILDQCTSVTLTLFNPLGQELMKPISGEWQDAGEHEVTIDAHNLLPGIYECRLNTGDGVMTAKMVVVK